MVGSPVAHVEGGGGVERGHARRRAVLVALQSVLLLLHLSEGNVVGIFDTVWEWQSVIISDLSQYPRILQ